MLRINRVVSERIVGKSEGIHQLKSRREMRGRLDGGVASKLLKVI